MTMVQMMMTLLRVIHTRALSRGCMPDSLALRRAAWAHKIGSQVIWGGRGAGTGAGEGGELGMELGRAKS